MHVQVFFCLFCHLCALQIFRVKESHRGSLCSVSEFQEIFAAHWIYCMIGKSSLGLHKVILVTASSIKIAISLT